MDAQLHKLRGIFRAGLFLGVTALFTAFQLLRFLLRDRCPHRAARSGRAWARTLIRLLGVRLEVWGSPPSGPVLLVSNHRSYIDIAAILSQTPCAFLAKAEVGRWPVVGLAARTNNTVFVHRDDRESRRQARLGARLHLEKGLAFAAFPEGTTSRAPQVLPFSPGLFHIAHERGFDICPLAIEYGDPDDAWTGEESFLAHFVRCVGKPRVRVSLSFGPRLRASTAEELRERAEAWVRANLRSPAQETLEPDNGFMPGLSAA